MKKIIAFICLLGMVGCYYDNEEELYPTPTGGGNSCDTTNISFATDIMPIFNQYCATAPCHSANVKVGGYDFSTHAGAKVSVDRQRLVGAIMFSNGFSPMPQGMAKLSDCNINKIKAWINQGAKDN